MHPMYAHAQQIQLSIQYSMSVNAVLTFMQLNNTHFLVFKQYALNLQFQLVIKLFVNVYQDTHNYLIHH